uniref:NADH dehydrogenase subunit 4L n=1 Tax=Lophogaster typicus TaxID=419538 RepID=UPI002176E6FF|nr:NADH dehydrogenase subunit 4L [Lophogaster typicus]UUL70706.1 NADH dehydrogenase subunit 4L [Lophogaster typicus]
MDFLMLLMLFFIFSFLSFLKKQFSFIMLLLSLEMMMMIMYFIIIFIMKDLSLESFFSLVFLAMGVCEGALGLTLLIVMSHFNSSDKIMTYFNF